MGIGDKEVNDMKKIITIHYIGGSNMEINKTEAVEVILNYLEEPEQDLAFIKIPLRSGEEVYLNMKLVTSIEVKDLR